ncbi:MAG: NapC/NirT family cytochrome c [Betaproteobacteria bacterium]|nr:NapC/NirT family cytochrome c [Betaproteobacteria bacterium]
MALAGLLLAAAAAAALYGYQLYDYVQHDNEFCLSCHLMVEPYERFARSEHRGLGCKACHQPTPFARAKMALTQIARSPAGLAEHAEVPNERCEACHIKGDPEKWLLISNTVGHRVHLASADPSLRGLKCVECHATSLHEFSPTDQTCAQAGCHEGVKLQLGRMSRLTLHCLVCHDYTKPVARAAPVAGVAGSPTLRPQAPECLSCHAMRRLGRFPADDPHRGVCGACHNPHEQTVPREAVASCATAGCHEQVASITGMHRGLEAGVLQDCVQCHEAHRFGVVSKQQCRACHQPVDGTQFSHTRHGGLECGACHATTPEHGTLAISGPRDCQSCHHGPQAAARCSACHAASEYAARSYPKSQRFLISVGEPRTRTLSFDHRWHGRVACAQCHTDPLTRSAAGLECTACHADHHEPTVSCMACHPRPPSDAHDKDVVHEGCSACHAELPLQGVPRTRTFCLICHQDRVEHYPEGVCTDCHALPGTEGEEARLERRTHEPILGRGGSGDRPGLQAGRSGNRFDRSR